MIAVSLSLGTLPEGFAVRHLLFAFMAAVSAVSASGAGPAATAPATPGRHDPCASHLQRHTCDADSKVLRPVALVSSGRAALRLRGGALKDSVAQATRTLFADKRSVVEDPVRGIQRHMRGVVFGGLDGILTTFALLAAVVGSAHASTSLTLVIGISTVLADALSMAAGEYLSAKAEQELQPDTSDDEPGPLEKGCAMFVAFTLFGSMPLLGFIASAAISHRTGIAAEPSDYFAMSVAITGVTLFALGTIKSTFGEGSWWRSGLEVSAIGGTAACVAYFSAHFVEKLIG